MDTNSTTGIPLLDKLIEFQKNSNLSDYKFANRLCIDRILWYKTRTLQRNIGLTLIIAILRKYPELTPDVIDFLRDGGKV